MIYVNEWIKGLIENKNFTHNAFFNCKNCNRTSNIIVLSYGKDSLNVFTFCENEGCYKIHKSKWQSANEDLFMYIKNIRNISEEEYQLFINLYNKARKALLLA